MYYNKYLKYKNKYLNLLQHKGGSTEIELKTLCKKIIGENNNIIGGALNSSTNPNIKNDPNDPNDINDPDVITIHNLSQIILGINIKLNGYYTTQLKYNYPLFKYIKENDNTYLAKIVIKIINDNTRNTIYLTFKKDGEDFYLYKIQNKEIKNAFPYPNVNEYNLNFEKKHLKFFINYYNYINKTSINIIDKIDEDIYYFITSNYLKTGLLYDDFIKVIIEHIDKFYIIDLLSELPNVKILKNIYDKLLNNINSNVTVYNQNNTSKFYFKYKIIDLYNYHRKYMDSDKDSAFTINFDSYSSFNIKFKIFYNFTLNTIERIYIYNYTRNTVFQYLFYTLLINLHNYLWNDNAVSLKICLNGSLMGDYCDRNDTIILNKNENQNKFLLLLEYDGKKIKNKLIDLDFDKIIEIVRSFRNFTNTKKIVLFINDEKNPIYL